jgi:hypothetical protein
MTPPQNTSSTDSRVRGDDGAGSGPVGGHGFGGARPKNVLHALQKCVK